MQEAVQIRHFFCVEGEGGKRSDQKSVAVFAWIMKRRETWYKGQEPYETREKTPNITKYGGKTQRCYGKVKEVLHSTLPTGLSTESGEYPRHSFDLSTDMHPQHPWKA